MAADTGESPDIAGHDPAKVTGVMAREGWVVPPMEEIAQAPARASSTDGRGDAARSDAARIVIPVFGSTLTVAVALAALILTSAHDTRQQLNEKLEFMRSHSDSQFGQVREDLREVRGDVRALAERVAKLEGFLLAGHPPGLVPPAETMGAESSTARAGDTGPDQE